MAKAAGDKTIVVFVTPGAALTPWAKDVSGVITPLMPGQAYGDAIASVLFGDVNPSGRLPLTFPNVENEVNFTVNQWPGVDGKAEYTEKLLVGYRWLVVGCWLSAKESIFCFIFYYVLLLIVSLL